MKPKRVPIRKTRTVRATKSRTGAAEPLADSAAPKRKRTRKTPGKRVATIKARRPPGARSKAIRSKKLSPEGSSLEVPTGSIAAVAGEQRVQSVFNQDPPETKSAVAEVPRSSKPIASASSPATGSGSSSANLATQAPAARPAHPPAQPPSSIQPKVESTSKRVGLPVPSILLEGDEPNPLPATGPGRKFALGPVPGNPAQETTPADLPEAYGTERLWLVARDPHCLYAHWDLAAQRQRQFNAQSVHQHLLVRIYHGHPDGRPLNEIHLHPESRHWFIHVDRAGVAYVAELGFYSIDGHWRRVALSEAAWTPTATRGEPGPAQFATMTFELPRPFQEKGQFSPEPPFRAIFNESATVQSLTFNEMTRSGKHQAAPTGPVTDWTEAQTRVVVEMSGWTIPQTERLGSIEITRLVQGQIQRQVELAPGELAPSSLEAAVFSPMPEVSGEISSPFGGEVPQQKQFWFNVNAELVIYGATEPDAQVTIGGRPIRLRPDGSFSYRFSLPDGTYDLPIEATAAHGDGRHAHLRFHRATSYSGQVGVHPQDPLLRTPHPGHVA